MSDEAWWEYANGGIVGIGPAPYNGDHWPSEGYDAPLQEYDDEAAYAGDVLGSSGRTREEWLALADEMLARWTQFRAFVTELPSAAKGKP